MTTPDPTASCPSSLTPSSVRDLLAKLLLQPAHPYRVNDRADTIRCAFALLKAIEIVDLDIRIRRLEEQMAVAPAAQAPAP